MNSTCHALMRFDKNLQEDRAFSDATSMLTTKSGRLYVLGCRLDGSIIVSLVQREKGSHIFFFGPQGLLTGELRMGF